MCDNLSIMWLKIIKHVYVECDEHILYLDLYKKWCSFMNGNGESRRQMFPEIFSQSSERSQNCQKSSNLHRKIENVTNHASKIF